jgi:hypothetical protein
MTEDSGSSKVLAAAVHVADEHGAMHVFSPNDKEPVPDWAREKITNPKAWTSAEDTDTAGGFEGPAGGPPPKSGKGSGRDAWAAYAEASGVEVTDDMKSKEDIVAALDQAGVPTE